ncbi:hypothetical protein HK405_015134 [Cladochytrium tenue]|nr:hypothetical protein HK405_015134 [Cladochytrium tenue]
MAAASSTSAGSSTSAPNVMQSATTETPNGTETHALPTELLKNVQAGNLELVRKQIVENNHIKRAFEELVGPESETILHFAILRNGKIAKMIAGAASDNFLAKSYQNERYFGETALHLAVVQNRPEVIDILLGCGKLDLKALATGYEFVRGSGHKGTHYAGMTALQFAVYHSTSKVVEKLLIGADMRKLFGLNNEPAAATDLIKQVDLYGNNVFHILAMRKSPANPRDIQEIKNINSAIRQRLIFQQPDLTYSDGKIEEDHTAKEYAARMKNFAKRFPKATNEGFAPAGELGAPQNLMDLLSDPNKTGLTPSQMAAFFDNSGFLEAIRLNQWKFGTSSASVIKVELLSKVGSHRTEQPAQGETNGQNSSPPEGQPQQGETNGPNPEGQSAQGETNGPNSSPPEGQPQQGEPNGPNRPPPEGQPEQREMNGPNQERMPNTRMGRQWHLKTPLEIACERRSKDFAGHPFVLAIFKAKWFLPPDVYGRFQYDYLRFFFEIFLLLSTIFSLRANARTSLWKYFFCGLVIVISTIRIVVLLSHISMISWTTKADYTDLSPLGNTTVDSLADGTGPALGSWLQLENFLFSAASICVWCNMLYFFKAFKSAGVLFRAFWEILADILTWSTMFVVFCLAFGGALFIQMEASDNDPWAPYWWTLIWVARFVFNPYIDKSLSDKAHKFYDSHIGFPDFQGSDGTKDEGRFIALVEINAKDGVPANVRKAVVGYWDENYQLSPPAGSSTSGANAPTATESPRVGTASSSDAQGVSSSTTETSAQKFLQSEGERAAAKDDAQGASCVVKIPSTTADIPPAAELYTKYQQLLATHMPVELRIAEDYWAHWLAGLWHIFAVYWVWDVLQQLIPSTMIYKKADLKNLQSGERPKDKNLWFGHPLVIRQKPPSNDFTETPVDRYGNFALE